MGLLNIIRRMALRGKLSIRSSQHFSGLDAAGLIASPSGVLIYPGGFRLDGFLGRLDRFYPAGHDRR